MMEEGDMDTIRFVSLPSPSAQLQGWIVENYKNEIRILKYKLFKLPQVTSVSQSNKHEISCLSEPTLPRGGSPSSKINQLTCATFTYTNISVHTNTLLDPGWHRNIRTTTLVRVPTGASLQHRQESPLYTWFIPGPPLLLKALASPSSALTDWPGSFPRGQGATSWHMALDFVGVRTGAATVYLCETNNNKSMEHSSLSSGQSVVSFQFSELLPLFHKQATSMYIRISTINFSTLYYKSYGCVAGGVMWTRSTIRIAKGGWRVHFLMREINNTKIVVKLLIWSQRIDGLSLSKCSPSVSNLKNERIYWNATGRRWQTLCPQLGRSRFSGQWLWLGLGSGS